METADQTSQKELEAESSEFSQFSSAPPGPEKPTCIDPDLDFINALSRRSGDTLKKCFQCGTCSAVCGLSPDTNPFPRKEMAWAVWGMKDRLLADPDVWLCYRCNDCTERCPRGARPGDVLGAVREECVRHYAAPRFLGRWVNQPHCIPLLLGIPATLLAVALAIRDPVERALGMSGQAGDHIIYSYSSLFPHWLLNTFFAFFSLITLAACAIGVRRFWRALKQSQPGERISTPQRGMAASIGLTVKSIVMHDKFEECATPRSRHLSHLCVFFGFFALLIVAIWVVTARYNPLIQGDFIYPFAFWNPWKILANAGGVALVGGCLFMMRDRLREHELSRAASYFDWSLIVTLLIAGLTGFVTELLHYLRLEPHRHVAYFVHLVSVFVVLMYLPYSKLAHVIYRTTAMVFVERFGRDTAPPSGQPAEETGGSLDG